MQVVGIDFSIQFPGICVTRDFDDFDFAAVINSKVSNKFANFIYNAADSNPGIHFTFTNRNSPPKGEEYFESERRKLLEMITLSSKITQQAKSLVGTEALIGMEGMSYGSKGSSLIDIAMGTGMVRSELLREIVKSKHTAFFVFSPGELKNAIGCRGNAKKDDIFHKFLEDPGIPAVMESDFYKFLSENRDDENVFRNGKVVSPWNDMIDAYLSILKIHNIVNGK